MFVIPGNHDVDRSKGEGLLRSLHDRSQADRYFASDTNILHVEHRLAAYAKWYDSFFEGVRTFPLNRTFSVERMEVRKKKVSVALINSAAFCIDESDAGKLLLGRRHVDTMNNEVASYTADLNMAVMHHPFGWLSSVEGAQTKTAIQDHFDCVLRGHLHENEIEQTQGSAGNAVVLAAGACYQTSKWPNTALVCSFSEGEVKVTPLRYVDSPRPTWALDTALYPDSPSYDATYSVLGRMPANPPTWSEPASTIIVNQSSSGLDASNGASPASQAQLQLEERLFVTPSGEIVYAEPRLMPRTQLASLEANESDEVEVSTVCRSTDSYLIEARAEYGGSTLCRVLHASLTKDGTPSMVCNARELPNYQRKLEEFFSSNAHHSALGGALIVDDFDAERDERMLQALAATNLFKRVIMVTVNRRLSDATPVDLDQMPFSPKALFS